MAATSSEQRELQLVEKLDFRILNVANDEVKLQKLLSVYLPPLLLKAGSEHAAVRAKVIQICQQLRTFIAAPGIILPVKALLEQYKTIDNVIVRRISISFVQHSIGRLEAAERRSLAPIVLQGFGSPNLTSASFFNVFLRILTDIQIPSKGTKEADSYRQDISLDNADDAQAIASWLGKLLLLRVNQAQPQAALPGLTSDEVTFLNLGTWDTWNPQASGGMSLPQTRIKAASFLASGAFREDELFMPALYAACHSDYRVAGVGNDLLKRSTVSMEDVPRIQSLFKAHAILPAPYRIRILGLLLKSAKSTSFTNDILQVTDLDLNDGSSSTSGAEDSKAAGLELIKLHTALFEYLHWVARIGADKAESFQVGPQLLDYLKTYIEAKQGWPKPETSQTADEVMLRAKAYEIIGALAYRSAQEMQLTPIVTWLFRSLAEDPTPEAAVSIEGALSALIASLNNVPKPHEPVDQSELFSSVVRYAIMEQQVPAIRSTRLAATKWVNKTLPFSHIGARWLDVLAVASHRDEKSDLVQEGLAGINPWTFRVNDDEMPALPSWTALVSTFLVNPFFPTADTDGMILGSDSSPHPFKGHRRQILPIVVKFCEKVLFLKVLKMTQVDLGWESQMNKRIRSYLPTRVDLRQKFAEIEAESLTNLLSAAFDGMLEDDATVAEPCARSFIRIASLCPQEKLQPLASRASKLVSLLGSNKKELRSLGARAIGMLAAHPCNPPDTVTSIKVMLEPSIQNWQKAVGFEMNVVEGSFLALGHMLSRAVYYNTTDSAQVIAGIAEIYPDPTALATAPANLQDTVFDSLTQLWAAGLPILPGGPDLIDEMINTLIKQCEKGNERAVTALGRLGIMISSRKLVIEESRSNEIRAMILAKLHKLHELKQVEIQFAVGQAILATIACWESGEVQLDMDVDYVGGDEASFKTSRDAKLVAETLQQMINDCKTTKPSLLKASGIWLFCAVQYGSHLPEVQSKLRECQVAFMRLLSARDELVQETASRGLSLVYEKGDADLKQDLVKDLVGAFTGSKTQIKVEEDTELFEAGALPTGEGKSVTSYKDIVSLANEVGDQSLVYKLMGLASNAATWSTRSAFGRFGLSNILSESEIDPKLYPKLYRYRFDPNQNVQRSMNDIWKALVKDSNAVVKEHFDAIMTDLLKSILGKEWRVRQASCAAIVDLVGGRSFTEYERYYGDIWTKALKVLDDVKSTVREEAYKLCKSLSKTLTHQLEAGGVSTSLKAMMNQALPFLLSDKGIESSVQEVKLFSTMTVLKITKTGGAALKPFIPAIIAHMLGLLSTIEPDAFNYYYQRSGEDSRAEIDKMRSSMVSTSPITGAIENCLRHADNSVMPDLMDKLDETIKTALGMPTKIGCSRVLTTLATRHASDFAPYCSRFLRRVEKQALDKNDEVSQNYARSAAYMLRAASSREQERFITSFIDHYFAATSETKRQKVADMILFFAKISPDYFTALESQLLPLAYLGSHDVDDYVQKAFREVWDTHAGGSRAVLRHSKEIQALLQRALDSAQWPIKHGGAFAASAMLQDIIGIGGTKEQWPSQGPVPVLKSTWPYVEQALRLKTFPGKEKILDALAKFAPVASLTWDDEDKGTSELKKIAIREAKRNNDEYRVHAFEALWKTAAGLEKVDMLDEVAEITMPHLDDFSNEDRMEVDKKDGKEDLVTQTAVKGFEAIAKGYSRLAMKTDPMTVLSNVAAKLKPFLEKRPRFDQIRRSIWCAAVKGMMEDAAKTSPGTPVATERDAQAKELIMWYFTSLEVDAPDVGTETQRSERIKAANALIEAWNSDCFQVVSRPTHREVVVEMNSILTKTLVEERSLDVQRLVQKALEKPESTKQK